MALESPNYSVERTVGQAEIRRYEPYLVASVTVDGSLERAGTAGSLPAPNDDRVSFEEVGPQRLAARRYSGRWSQGAHDRHLLELRDTLEKAGLGTTGEPIWARYDPPWKPWFLRHNEVLLALED